MTRPETTIVFFPLRLRIAVLGVAASILLALSLPASAVIKLDVTSGRVKPIPVAVTEFLGLGANAEIGRDIAGVITADLVRSGRFDAIDSNAFIDKVRGVEATPRFQDWRLIKARVLLVGSVNLTADNRMQVQFRLWDVLDGKSIVGRRFTTSQQNWRRIAHKIADAVYARMTGEDGYFDTRVVFVEERDPKGDKTKRLAIMDSDGANVEYLTGGDHLVLTPRFNPAMNTICYVSYETGKPQVKLMNLNTRRSAQVNSDRGLSFAPQFSPDGGSLVMSRQLDGYANLYSFDLRTRRWTQLTDSASINTAPSFSPDGSQIVFESDRGGSSQLYVMSSGGGEARRITFGKGSYGTPAWSPRGDTIAFTKRYSGSFMIGVVKTDGSDERILTEGWHNEGPTWAPNGRVLMFFRQGRGAKGPNMWTVDVTGYIEKKVDTPTYASDPSWSRLRK